MKTYRVGLIGFGFIGKVHAFGHRNLPLFYDQQEFGTQITHVCTAHAATAEKAKSVTGAGVAVTDFHEITENPDIDIVDICTPNDSHYEALISAIAHNKHIYCDKPITSTAHEALKVREALKSYKGISQMTLQNRFFPASLRAKEIMESGLLGDILEFHGKFLHSGSVNPESPLKWKLRAGTIADLGSHILDLMTWLLGDFSELTATTHIAYPERPDPADPSKRLPVTAEDNMSVIACLPNGASGTITASKIAAGSEDCPGFLICGSKGALRWDPMNLDQLFYYDCRSKDSPYGGMRGWTAIDCGQRYEKPAGFPTPKAPIGWLRGHAHCLYSFLKAVHTGKQTGPSLEDGIRLQLLLEKVRESAESRKWVRVTR